MVYAHIRVNSNTPVPYHHSTSTSYHNPITNISDVRYVPFAPFTARVLIHEHARMKSLHYILRTPASADNPSDLPPHRGSPTHGFLTPIAISGNIIT